MGFSSRCVLRFSHPTMFRKLTALGLSPNPFGQNLAVSENHWTIVYDGCYSTILPARLPEEVYDCDCNGNMFLALAALNDSTDFGQWFIYEDDEDEEWFKCIQDDMTDMMWESQKYRYCRKATPDEIIEHFSYC